MAGSPSDDCGVGRSSEGISSGQRCQSGEALAEWRSSDQVENGTPSTSPPYWDTDGGDDDCGQKPSELYGKFTWKIENFSQISKRELRSNAFEVGGYKWYILIYPQGCDVCNHLSLFLCVANHDKLLPGWSHFAQFTIAVVNKDPKKSKYSDTLHRFWKKEHDWGWKKFMELSKVLDGFIISDTLVIKAQVQVISENAYRPFRCLDCQYRRELVRVYVTNVEQICRRFVEERRGKLMKLIEDKARWPSFCAFWLEVDHYARRGMSQEKTDAILKVVVKHFFIEKEVTSTLVMDSLYSGLRALEFQSTSKKGRAKSLDTEEAPAPIVRLEEDMFVLADDVLLLLERAALEPLPPKDEKGPQNRTKDGSSGEDFNKDSIERDERRLTELGRRTVEIYVLAHIFSNKIEVAYQEAVALKRQEELIREEEAAGQADCEQRAKRGATEREKRAKKKQGKHKRNSRKGKDKGKDEKSDATIQDKQQEGTPDDMTSVDVATKQVQSMPGKLDTLEDVSDASDAGDDVAETLQPESEDRDATTVYWDTDTSEVHLTTEISSSGLSGHPLQNGRAEKSVSVMDDSSSTCSTDSVPSVVLNGPRKGNKILTSLSRGKNQRGKETRNHTVRIHDMDNQASEYVAEAGCQYDTFPSCKAIGRESEAVLSLKDQIKWLQQHLVEKEEEVVTLQKKLDVKDQIDIERPSKQFVGAEALSSPGSPTKNAFSNVQPKLVVDGTIPTEPNPIRETSSNSTQKIEKAIPSKTPSPQIPISKPDVQNPETPSKSTYIHTEKTTTNQVAAMPRPSSAPLIPAPPKPSAPVVSIVQTTPSLARSVSAAGRLGTDPSPATHSYVPPSYRNAIMGRTMGSGPVGFTPSSSVGNQSPVCSQTSSLLSPPMLSPQNSNSKDQGLVRSGFTFGSVSQEVLQSQPPWISESSQPGVISRQCDPSLLSDIQNLDIYGHASTGSRTYFADELPASVSSRQAQGMSAEDFPHLDIINYLLDEEQSIGRAAKTSAVFHSPNNGHHPLNRQFTFPGDMAMSADMGPSINCCRFDRPLSYYDDGMHQVYDSSSVPFEARRDVIPPAGLSAYANGQRDGMIQNQWPLSAGHVSMLNARNTEGDRYRYPEYSNLACGVNSYNMFRPSSGH